MKEIPLKIIKGMPYIATLRAFNKVVEACFGMVLESDYKETNSKFSKLYREIEISVTPKVLISIHE